MFVFISLLQFKCSVYNGFNVCIYVLLLVRKLSLENQKNVSTIRNQHFASANNHFSFTSKRPAPAANNKPPWHKEKLVVEKTFGSLGKITQINYRYIRESSLWFIFFIWLWHYMKYNVVLLYLYFVLFDYEFGFCILLLLLYM